MSVSGVARRSALGALRSESAMGADGAAHGDACHSSVTIPPSSAPEANPNTAVSASSAEEIAPDWARRSVDGILMASLSRLLNVRRIVDRHRQLDAAMAELRERASGPPNGRMRPRSAKRSTRLRWSRKSSFGASPLAVPTGPKSRND